MNDIYDRIGDTYDTTRTSDPQIAGALAAHINLQPTGKYLDVGCGSGNYTTALNRAGGRWTGLEPSSHMLQLARDKDMSVTWVQAAAESLPFADAAFDAVICTAAIHHFTSLAQALREIDRVLTAGGKLVIFTATPQQVRSYWLCRYFPQMMHLDAQQLPSVDQIRALLQSTGLQLTEVEPFFVTPQIADLLFYSGKHHPSMYLDDNIRNSMSPFRTLISDRELNEGLTRLDRDINSGAIRAVIDQSGSEAGDYCFVIIDKRPGG